MTCVYNYSAGPAVLPREVLQQAAEEMLDWHGSGMSVMEMSHRGAEFISIYEAAVRDFRELLGVPDNYKVLFLQGGGLGENAIVPMNLIGRKPQPAVVDFIHTGSWSGKSLKEAQKYAKVNVAASSEAGKFTTIPPRDTWKLSKDPAYVHVCTNETSMAPNTISCRMSVQTPTMHRWSPTCRRISCPVSSMYRNTA